MFKLFNMYKLKHFSENDLLTNVTQMTPDEFLDP